MECLFYPALLCLVPYENNSILEIYWINHNRIEHTAEDTITQHHQGAQCQLLLLVRNDSLSVSQRCLHVLGLDQIDRVCTFPLKLPHFFSNPVKDYKCKSWPVQAIRQISDVRPIYRKAKLKHKPRKGMLNKLLNSDSTTHLFNSHHPLSLPSTPPVHMQQLQYLQPLLLFL